MGIKQRLRPYQLEAAHAILQSVLRNRGLTITVEVARQGGKNELSAQLELLLLTLNRSSGGNLIKSAPTYMPQLLNSIFRLKDRLNDAGYKGLWTAEGRNSFRVGNARQVFLSAEPSSRVVGATAHVLLEMDEAQEIDKTKYYKEFRPMGASTNATTVLYGTPWDGDSLLEEQKQLNLELERRDGVRRHFRYDWQEVARHNPLYKEYVEGERLRLGERPPHVPQPVHAAAGARPGRPARRGAAGPATGRPLTPSLAGAWQDIRGGPGHCGRSLGKRCHLVTARAAHPAQANATPPCSPSLSLTLTPATRSAASRRSR